MTEGACVESFEALSAEAVVAEVVQQAPSGNGLSSICLTSSFQTEDMVVLHMLRAHLPRVPVIFLETGYHFAELIAYRDLMVREWNLNLVNAVPVTTLADHEKEFGLLHIVEPTKCCAIRKVEPLMRSLEPYSWWFTGLRREQSPTRAGLKKVEDHRLPSGKVLKKVSVLADWGWDRVEGYAIAHGIPRLSLYDEGYTSYWLCAVHGQAGGGSGSSQRTVGRQEAGVRDSYVQREGL